MHNIMRATGVACFLIATALFAQFETAEVLGTVRDPSGGAISKATVTLTNPDTGIQAKTTTDESGNYDFFNVKVGRYTRHGGTKRIFEVHHHRCERDCECPAARGRLHAGGRGHARSVEVTGVAAALETDSSEHGQVINTAAVTEFPLNGRNYADLALLVHQRREVSDRGLLLAQRHAARRRLQRERHAQHV